MLNRQEGDGDGNHQQDQVFSWKESLASRCAPRHHMKFHKGGPEDGDRRSKEPASPLIDPGQGSWWKALDDALI